MQYWQIVLLAVAVVVLVAAAVWAVYYRSRSKRLQSRFGAEYDRTVHEIGDRRRAESELLRREDRVRKLNVRPLGVTERHRFSARWMDCQRLFVDDPARAVTEADNLLTEVIRARGYSSDSPYERMADISAAYPEHSSGYRAAGETLSRNYRGEASTEDLRSAFIHYRALFDEILGGQDEELKRAS
jgi:hypothetical protein